MKKKLYLKPFVIPAVYSLLVIGLLASVFVSVKNDAKEEEHVYVSGTILDENVPVVSTIAPTTLVGKPYNNENVVIGKDYYD